MNRLLFAISAILSPVIVACFDLSVWAALGLILGLLLWRQALIIAPLTRKPTGPELELESILASHFVEKARWCMDRLGIEYTERPWAGVIGVVFRGRTVPQLHVQSNRTRSSLGDSSLILRYLYGRYASDPDVDAAFLAPTPDRLEWEERLDRYGVDLQIWVYHHLLDDPELCKFAWGLDSERLPASQRLMGKLAYPFLAIFIRRAFNPDAPRTQQAIERIDGLLATSEACLEDGRDALLAGEAIDFVDLTLASLSSLWVQPEQFAAGAFPEMRFEADRIPPKMRSDMDRWRETFPRTTAHIERLYAKERS